MRKLKRNEDAFTGLEAAIVLIAFVVVAAVFSYVVLGAGFFTTQKSQQVVHAGVTQAASNIVVKGNVYGIGTNSEVTTIWFDIGLAAGGLPVDVEKIAITFSTPNSNPVHVPYDVQGTYPYWVYSSDNMQSPPLLKEGESANIRLIPPPDVVLGPRDSFVIELKPENGADLGIERTLPAGLTTTNILY